MRKRTYKLNRKVKKGCTRIYKSHRYRRSIKSRKGCSRLKKSNRRIRKSQKGGFRIMPDTMRPWADITDSIGAGYDELSSLIQGKVPTLSPSVYNQPIGK